MCIYICDRNVNTCIYICDRNGNIWVLKVIDSKNIYDSVFYNR